MIEELINVLNGSIQEAQCLLTIIRFMASECEDESIVIEETLRESFYEFIDFHSSVIFKQVHTYWSE
jgi:hypothetical protein